ncbi:MAG: prepilin-type N-terminal cleavage/methylation domain-containing protein [Planctomycetota bacterium]
MKRTDAVITTGPNRFPARGTQSGFTIMEIMIATAILVIGLLGILALFPYAIDLGKRTIQDTNAVAIARSVEQALRESIALRKAQSKDGKWTYFVFQHDGVLDPLPRRLQDAEPSKDYYILLPDIDTDASERVLTRAEAYAGAKLFLYPEDDGASWTQVVQGIEKAYEGEAGARPNGGGDPTAADNDADDHQYFDEIVAEDGTAIVATEPRLSYRVRRAYEIGAERLRDPEADVSDPIYQYSYAFTIQRASRDASLGQTSQLSNEIVPAGELYEVELLVFRSFLSESEAFSRPVYQTKILLNK